MEMHCNCGMGSAEKVGLGEDGQTMGDTQTKHIHAGRERDGGDTEETGTEGKTHFSNVHVR